MSTNCLFFVFCPIYCTDNEVSCLWKTIQIKRAALNSGMNRANAIHEKQLLRSKYLMFNTDDLRTIQKYFHELILERNKNNDAFLSNENIHLPIISNEIFEKREWYAVPGMYGGFAYELTQKDGEPLLISESWCRVVDGSGQRHEITTCGCVLTDKGFV